MCSQLVLTPDGPSLNPLPSYLDFLLLLAFLALGGDEGVDCFLDLFVIHADAAPLGRSLLPLRRRGAPANTQLPLMAHRKYYKKWVL